MGMEFLVPPEDHREAPPGRNSMYRIDDIVVRRRTGRVGRIDGYITSGYGRDLFAIRYPSGATRTVNHLDLIPATPSQVATFLAEEEIAMGLAIHDTAEDVPEAPGMSM